MPKYVIEREIPGAGKLTSDQLKAISQTSCNVLRKLGPEIQWVHSYVTGDKVYCVYISPNEQLIREHASQGGFPANRISEVSAVIDHTTSEDYTNSPCLEPRRHSLHRRRSNPWLRVHSRVVTPCSKQPPG